MSNRKCRQCDTEKPLTEFPPYKAKGRSGRRWTCRECWNRKWTPIVVEHNSRYYHENVNGYRDRQKARTSRRHKREGAAVRQRRNRDYEQKYPERAAAKKAVFLAVRSGRLAPLPCEVCGEPQAQAHHDNYARPLDVIWLCPLHHGERHRLINRGEFPKGGAE